MKNLKMFVIGFVTATTLLFSTSAFAETLYDKIQVSIRDDIKVVANNEKVSLQKAPLSLEGSTYIYIRDLEKVLDKDVKWNGTTQTIEVNDKKGASSVENVIEETTYKDLSAIKKNGEIFIMAREYDKAVTHSDTSAIMSWDSSYAYLTIEKNESKYILNRSNAEHIFIYKGNTYFNSKYYI